MNMDAEIIGRVEKTNVFYLDNHRITQARIAWEGHKYWPQCFTWIDGREWPYRDTELKGHNRFPEKYWIRKVIKRWYGEQTKQ